MDGEIERRKMRHWRELVGFVVEEGSEVEVLSRVEEPVESAYVIFSRLM